MVKETYEYDEYGANAKLDRDYKNLEEYCSVVGNVFKGYFEKKYLKILGNLPKKVVDSLLSGKYKTTYYCNNTSLFIRNHEGHVIYDISLSNKIINKKYLRSCKVK